MILSMIPIVIALDTCQAVIKDTAIPCKLITTWVYDSCSSHKAAVYLNNGTNKQNYTLTTLLNGYCSLTFNLTANNSYFGQTDLNDTFNIQVIKDGDTVISSNMLLGFVTIVWIILLCLAFFTRVPLMIMLTGLMTFGIGISLYWILPAIAYINIYIPVFVLAIAIILLIYGWTKGIRY